MKTAKTILILATVAMLAGPVLADWDPGDYHKMHYPQLPDPNGWDVAWSTNLADDWQCTHTGPVEDIHIWFSWHEDEDLQAQIGGVSVMIRDDDRSGAYSKPSTDFRWLRYFTPGQFTIIPYGTGDQGWYDPMVVPPVVMPSDHQGFYQLNITDITNPFVQEFGTIYWLDVYVQDAAGEPMPIGWKTSGSPQFEDDAVYWAGNEWLELYDPLEPTTSLDLAFVITPEPGAMVLLVLGGLGVLLRRRRSKIRLGGRR